MTVPDLSEHPRLLASLSRVARRKVLARKLVVSPTLGAARELLRRLADLGQPWIGFEATTARALALQLARREMEAGGLTALDGFEQQALLDEALDSAIVSAESGLGELAEGVGFRTRVHEAIIALRLADVEPRKLEVARLPDARKRLLVLRVLRRYERLLTERGRADTATIMRLALAALEEGGSRLPPELGDEMLLLPGIGMRGLAGRFIAALATRGARVLETDAVVGREVPSAWLWNRGGEPRGHSYLHAPERVPEGVGRPRVELFRAASINDELREVLRRVVARGLRWDQVEIVAADASAYGSALHALSVRLGIPVTYAVGLPVERTRAGRVARGYLDWIEEGFQASPIRRLLEAGDLRSSGPHRHLAPAALARRFRSLRIGWGRARYRAQIRDALAGADRLEPRRFEPPESFEKRVARTKQELQALRSILFPALKATPTVPDRMGEGGAPVSPAELATGLLAFLRRVPRGRGAERAARDEVTRVLERVRATLRRRTEFRAAVTILRRHLQIRVRAEVPGSTPDDPGAPWSSKGGHLHLSDLAHGGFADRDAVFFVGLDADRFPGSGSQDPLLLDRDRRILSDALPTSSEVVREQAFAFAALFARLRGPVTMSYAAWDAAEARSISPSPVLLQALRLSRGDPTLTFRDLHQAVGRVVCAIPRGGGAPLDGDDVWMAELGCGDVMRHGVGAVRAAFPRLDAGLVAKSEREGGPPGPFHGVVQPRPDVLDPRRNDSIVVSPSRLEALGACPLRYLHDTVLGVRAPEDPELDPDCWLNAMQRGSLLHGVYETTLREARERGVGEGEPAFESLALDILRRRVDSARDEVPVPGEGTWRRERAALEEDVRSFVRMVREIGAPWIRLEFGFGLAGGDPVPLDLGEGRVLLRGVVDRIDDRGLEGIRVVDYKTGASGWFAEGGTFNGGRRLQAALYTHAVEAELGARVAAGEYHFPTREGENEVIRYDRLSLAAVGEVVGHLLDGVAQGAFVPTDRPDDCRFCDYSAVCRVRTLEWGKVSAPLAEWSQQHVNAGVLPVFGPLQRARTFES